MAKQKPVSSKTIGIIFLSLGVLMVLTYCFSYYLNKPRFVKYPAFGIDMPINYLIHGIDVSRHQSSINWEDVQAMQIKNIKIGFSFIKATEGIESIDPRFRRNWFEAKQNNIPRGAYHFFNPGISGKAQAQNFIETVKLEKGDLPPVLDIEQINNSSVLNLQQRVADWIKIVEAYYKVKPIIYTNADFYEHYLSPRFDEYPLWVAHYLVKDKPRVKRKWVFWQHNEAGRVNGVDAYVDFNVFNGDSVMFKNLLIK